MQEHQFVRFLNDLGKEDLPSAGGKGANLGEMIRAGLSVPEGFAVLVDAYRKFVQENTLEKEIANLLSIAESGKSENLREAADRVRGLFVIGKIPAEILKEIDILYTAIGLPPVAVRSSATAEDLPGASFAGQYSTFLNVRGKEELYEAIKKCWASLWNERALSYRTKQSIDSKNLAHGVVVQRLIASEKSGILFTANPVNGRRDQLSLSSSWGLGEAIVSGEVDPDQWVIDKNTGETVSAYVASKKVMTLRKAGGTELVSVEPQKQTEVTLDEAERKELMDLALKVEEYFKSPQDLEWAFEESRFYLVQTRPITALYPMPKPEDQNDKLHIYLNASLYSVGTHEPLTPLAVDIWKNTYINIGRRINRKYYHEPVYWSKSAGGRLFLDITELIKLKQFQDRMFTDNKIDKDPVTIKLIMQLLEREKEELQKPKTPLLKSIINIIAKVNPWFIRFILASLPKILYGVLFPNRAIKKAYQFGSNKIAKLEEERKKLRITKEKLDFIERIGPENILFNSFEILFFGAVSLGFADKARKVIFKHGLDLSEVDKAERAVPDCVTTEMGMEMLQLAKQFDQNGEEPVQDHPEIKKFLLKYGHRANEEIDFGLPTWNEEPGYVVGLISSYIENKTYQYGIEKFYHDMEEAEQAIETLTGQLRAKGAQREANKVERWLRDYRKLYGIRELPKFMLLKTVSLIREILLEIGDELRAEGRLEQREDIFMVDTRDILSADLLHEKIRQNREEFLREIQRKAIPRIITSTGETFYSAIEDKDDDPNRGVPVSPGVVEGTVKVLDSPYESNNLKQGDILVTTSTNPAWTPLFLIIGGLILETGGPISHGSVVAREYGIPAVVGVKEATTRFKDGQRVRLNGETGSVEIIDSYTETLPPGIDDRR